MSSQIIFYKKNKADYSDPSVAVTASEGSAYAPYVQRRSNSMGWMTTGSVDANNTTLTVNFANTITLTDIILVGHNFKNFKIQYWSGSAWTDFSPALSLTACVDSTTHFSFASMQTSQLLLTVFGTQVANSDKKLNQFIASELIGKFQGWPAIKNPTWNRQKIISKMLSGKDLIADNVGGFTLDLYLKCWNVDADFAIIETLYNSGGGFLVWPCGGDETQFQTTRQGFRLQDIFLMKCRNNYIPEQYNASYHMGTTVTISLSEVTT